MKKNEPLSFSGGHLSEKQSLPFGGTLLNQSHARGPRPISSKHCLHVVLRSDAADLSHSEKLRLTKKKSQINVIIKERAETFGVSVHKVVIAANRIHLLVSFKNRKVYFNWIRRVTGLIARLMLNAEKGRPSKGPIVP